MGFPIAKTTKNQVLTKAFIRLSNELDITRQELALIIGLSEATLSRVFTKPDCLIDPITKEGQLILLLLRTYRSLSALFGGNMPQCQLWLRSHNLHLEGVPIQLIQSISGLVMVVQYLDAIRGKI